MLGYKGYKVSIICVVYPRGLVSFLSHGSFCILFLSLTLSFLLAYKYRSKTYQ